MQPYTTNPPQPCPVCNADARYRTWSVFANNNSAYTHVVSNKHKMMGSTTVPLVSRGAVMSNSSLIPKTSGRKSKSELI